MTMSDKRAEGKEQCTAKCTLLLLLYTKPCIPLEQSRGLLFQGIIPLYEIFTKSGPNLSGHSDYTVYKIYFARSCTEEHETLKNEFILKYDKMKHPI